MKEQFKTIRFTQNVLARINLANSILADLARQGYMISLRQLYYQLVSRGAIPNNVKEYKKLGDTLSKARLAGLVDWSVLEDRGRNLRGWSGGYDSPSSYFSELESGYFRDLWEGQENYVEVWVEKDALVGVIQRPCDALRVRYFSCRGYSSQTEQYAAGKRFARAVRSGRTCHVIHLGDHDPSGLDMTRDNQERLDMFSANGVEVHRIALNMDQVEELKPPPNPAKMTDSRVGNYLAQYGRQSWELDALPPAYIDRIITEKVNSLIDHDLMDQQRSREDEEGAEVQETASALGRHYHQIREYMRDNDLL